MICAVMLHDLLIVVVPDLSPRILLPLVSVRLAVQRLPRVPLLIEAGTDRESGQTE